MLKQQDSVVPLWRKSLYCCVEEHRFFWHTRTIGFVLAPDRLILVWLTMTWLGITQLLICLACSTQSRNMHTLNHSLEPTFYHIVPDLRLWLQLWSYWRTCAQVPSFRVHIIIANELQKKAHGIYLELSSTLVNSSWQFLYVLDIFLKCGGSIFEPF